MMAVVVMNGENFQSHKFNKHERERERTRKRQTDKAKKKVVLQ